MAQDGCDLVGDASQHAIICSFVGGVYVRCAGYSHLNGIFEIVDLQLIHNHLRVGDLTRKCELKGKDELRGYIAY